METLASLKEKKSNVEMESEAKIKSKNSGEGQEKQSSIADSSSLDQSLKMGVKKMNIRLDLNEQAPSIESQLIEQNLAYDLKSICRIELAKIEIFEAKKENHLKEKKFKKCLDLIARSISEVVAYATYGEGIMLMNDKDIFKSK